VRGHFNGGARVGTMDRDEIDALRREPGALIGITVDTQFDEYRLSVTDWIPWFGKGREFSVRLYTSRTPYPVPFHSRAGRHEGPGGPPARQGWILSEAVRANDRIVVPDYHFHEGTDSADPQIRTYIYSEEAERTQGDFRAPYKLADPAVSADQIRTAIAPGFNAQGDEPLLCQSIETYHTEKISGVLGAMGIAAGIVG
jgi:hypothetical protein